MTDGIFSGDVAPYYDESAADMFDPDVLEPTVELLAGLAVDGRALEFAVGAGRVALPLSGRGVDEYDVVNQRLISHHAWNPEFGRVRCVPVTAALCAILGTCDYT